ncbi:Ig-like domain-containing protein [Jatrophihabitans sp.]|uniref:Ig-like domain-containing protein n=1 Tax=Jatrophihabitans sp. TaxID=1932789 RepID=UPI0030C73F7A|nr:hypothetical protein [Jatrophihabitans sp.]
MTSSILRLGAGIAATAAILFSAPALAGAAPSATPASPTTSTSPSPSASTAATAGVRSVTVTPAKPAVTAPVTITVSWCLPSTSTPGSKLALTVPAQLVPLTRGFTLHDDAGDVVASATVTGNTVTLTAGSYVADHDGVCGSVSFPAAINSAHVTVNRPNTLVFGSGARSVTTSFTPTEVVGAKTDEAITYGIWTNPYDQGRTSPTDALTWYLESPVAPAPYGSGTVRFLDTAGRGQHLDCTKVHVELGRLDRFHHFVFTETYRGTTQTTCSATTASVRIPSLRSGTVARLVIGSSIEAGAATPFTNSGQVSLDGGSAPTVRSTDLVHYLPTGHASAVPVAPTAPTSATSAAAAAAAHGSRSENAKAASDDSHNGGLALLIGLGVAAAIMVGVALRSRRGGATA